MSDLFPTRQAVDAGALIIIGASTGGVRVLCSLFQQMPPLRACILLVQHMPKFIQDSFANTLQKQTRMRVALAKDGDELREGHVFIAQAELHTQLCRNRKLHVAPGPKVNFVCPSIDVAMMSVIPQPERRIIGVLLTGMGRDGADGMAHMKKCGATTIAQDESTCAVFGMPREAWRAGAVQQLLPPDRIASSLAQMAH